MNQPTIFYPRVRETTTTTGTGTITLAGAVSGYQSFSVVGNSSKTRYYIVDQSGANWEEGIGTYTSSGTTLSRDTILNSSNAGAAVSFGSGTKDVFQTYTSDLFNRLPISCFDHYADAGNTSTNGTEDDLYSDTLVANTFLTNGDKVQAEYECEIVASATATRRIQAYVAGTNVLDSGTQTFTSGGSALIYVTIIRESSTVLRVMAEFVPSGITLQPVVKYTRITGLTLTSTQIVKITGIATGTGAAANDIVAKLGDIIRIPAA
jgi:hypothetical protein